MTDTLERADEVSLPDEPRDGRLRTVLLVIIAVAALVLAAGGGWLLRGTDQPAASGPNAVDVGFAQDMATHHTQAVTMAGIERDRTTSTPLRSMAFDIETGQQFQLGEMQGWLDQWGKSRNNDDEMAWMGHQHMAMGANGLMPGMATPAQMTELVHLRGKALDVLFLQLMIHHHQGGIPMAQYAFAHAADPAVRNMAQVMISAQSDEVIQMEQALRALGSSPLPPPE